MSWKILHVEWANVNSRTYLYCNSRTLNISATSFRNNINIELETAESLCYGNEKIYTRRNLKAIF